MRDDTQTASSRAVTPVPAAVRRNHASALRSSVLSGVRGCVTSSRACTTSSGVPAPPRITRKLELADRGVVGRVRPFGRAVEQLCPRVTQRHDDRSIAGQPREKSLVHGHATDNGERPPADEERLDTRQREKLTFGAASRHQRDAARAVQRRRQSRLDAAMLVPEVTGADNPVIAILNLEHRETSETHGGARVVEQIVPFRLDAGNRRETKPIVVQQRALERRKPLGNRRHSRERDLRE